MQRILKQIVFSPNKEQAMGMARSLFLAGTIEMGNSINWQETIGKQLTHGYIFNPRRTDWNSDWVQSIDNAPFAEQVNWELNHIETCDFIFFYFDPASKSPITLLELGLCAGMDQFARRVIVCCPDGYYRKGNVDIVCNRYGFKMVATIDEFVSYWNDLILD